MRRKTVLVTGASGGIGEACVRRLSESCTVLAHANHGTEKVRNLCRELCGMGRDVHAVQADLSTSAEVRKMTEEILSLYHGIDGLVHAAGIAFTGLLTEMTDEEWDRVIGTNLSSAFYLCRAFLPGMIRKQSGSVVLISSMWGQAGASCEAAYSTSKAGLIGLGKALSRECGPSGVRVNCVAPGVIDTAMMAAYSAEDRLELAQAASLSRLGTPEDVAGLCAFLMGDEASFITGQVIGVDGGFL